MRFLARCVLASLAWFCLACLANGQEQKPAETGVDALINSATLESAGNAPAVWSELGPVKWINRNYTRVAPDVMVVEADAVRMSSSGYQVRIPALFVLTNAGGEWRIAYKRELANALLPVPPANSPANE